VVAAVAGIALCLIGAHVIDGYSLFYVEFFLGALAYRIYDRTSPYYPGVQLTIAFALYFIIRALLDVYQASVLKTLIAKFGFGAMRFLLINGLIGLDAKYKLAKYPLPRLLARIGNASYSLYLSHQLVFLVIGRFSALIPGSPVFLIMIWHILAIVIAIVFAVIFAENVELPLHRNLVNYLKSQKSRCERLCTARRLSPLRPNLSPKERYYCTYVTILARRYGFSAFPGESCRGFPPIESSS
jgi:peptidoglycan/LPS O-acetylase OafA/YrhL